MAKFSAVGFSIFVAVVIAVFLVFSIFGILYFYWGDASAVKDSIATVGSFFGGFATLGAAIIAAYLFNDWRDQKKYELEKEYIEKFAASVFDIYQSIFLQSSQVLYIYENYNTHEICTILKLSNVDFLKISEKQESAYYHSSLISLLDPKSKFKSNYENFQECLTYLCWMNDQVYNIYSKGVLNSIEESPLIAFHADEKQMSQMQLNMYKRIMKIIDKKSPININNQEKHVSYSELLDEFTNSFDKLNSEIIESIKP